MKRDEKLMYQILDLLEELPYSTVLKSKVVDLLEETGLKIDAGVVEHHMRLLLDRGCVAEMTSATTGATDRWRITDNGHNLAAKNPERNVAGFASLEKQ
ncbi:hypothetical protein [Paraburkholderia bryophila]|uniref:ArsR family transcriptional regulator n=1 Tax=Paraburkholderia bryophila TaxID=420952 RepID=A0A329CPZ1_9BURK|nr:hypothetical protein [Paraburkholderia bryophila]RAS35862.1 hypothetical protein BX591_104192 [Paraburkholderia bryophila]